MSDTDFDLDKFIKLMMMTTSSHDNEALVALRKANGELLKIDANWEQVIRGRVQINQVAPAPQPAPNTNPAHRRDPHIDEWFDLVFANYHGSASFADFLQSIHEWWKANGFLTEKQYQALERAVANAGREPPRRRNRWY